MRQIFQILHHRSLTISVVAVFFALVSFVFLPESSYRFQHLGMRYLWPASITAVLGVSVCFITIVNLIRDDKSGYPSLRLSVATLIWALSCVPIIFLSIIVIGYSFR